MYTPDQDGITHINVYTKSNTEIGKLLSNLSDSPINHPKYGYFFCLESLWYWLILGKNDHQLKDMNGYEAKKFGQAKITNKEEYDFITESKSFRAEFKDGIRAKLLSNTKTLQLLVDTKNLPITHYYFYTPKDGDLSRAKVIYKDNHQWQMDIISEIRLKTIKWLEFKKLSNLDNCKFIF